MSTHRRPLRVLFAAAEAVPYSKVGGLADVAGSLPQALAQMGHDVRLVTPLHGDRQPPGQWVTTFPITTLGQQEEAVIHRDADNGVTAYLVESPRYFRRPAVYGQPDDLQRYWFFCQTVLELPRRLSWSPDILHCHDWHAAPLAFGLRNRAWGDPAYQATSSLLTIHNLRYRGPDELADFLCQGIYYSDLINTVSETYAREILTPEFGEGLDSLLRLRQGDLAGIVNGLDYREFDPARDPYLASHFDAGTVQNRAGNLQALLERMGMQPEPVRPTIGMVGRLTEQKGVDLALEALEPLLAEERLRLIVLGQGEKKYADMLADMQRRFPQLVGFMQAFDEGVARLIYGGCEMFLMPSRFEPCGLGQLIAQRYGCVPVVRRTGGLNDTVTDYSTGAGTGFVFEAADHWALQATLDRALTTYAQDPQGWVALMQRGMATDFSWRASAEKYEGLYYRALARRGG